MIGITVVGAAGKVGASIIRLAESDKEIKITGAVESKERIGLCSSVINISTDLSEVINKSDVVIDFSAPEITCANLPIIVKAKKALVIGTTGFNNDQGKLIKAAAKEIPIVWSPNLSLGVSILYSLVAQVAQAVPNYDIEIIELHHNQKKDAPSGTALQLAKVAAEALDRDFSKAAVYGRKGADAQRKKGDIGIHALRAGGIIGDHTVYFTGPSERIELTHRAQSRDNFAIGAIRAAKWVSKKPVRMYDMHNVLGLDK